MQGTAKIMEKINSLTFQKIGHNVTSIDCHPMFDGGILVNVMGQLKTDEVRVGRTSLLYSAILMIICPNIMSEP